MFKILIPLMILMHFRDYFNFVLSSNFVHDVNRFAIISRIYNNYIGKWLMYSRFIDSFDKNFNNCFLMISLNFFIFINFQLCWNRCFDFLCVRRSKTIIINKWLNKFFTSLIILQNINLSIMLVVMNDKLMIIFKFW